MVNVFLYGKGKIKITSKEKEHDLFFFSRNVPSRYKY